MRLSLRHFSPFSSKFKPALGHIPIALPAALPHVLVEEGGRAVVDTNLLFLLPAAVYRSSHIASTLCVLTHSSTLI